VKRLKQIVWREVSCNKQKKAERERERERDNDLLSAFSVYDKSGTEP